MLVGGRLLLEREGELYRLRGLLARAAAGEGALAVVTGPAGIGKTRLARAVREEAQSAGFRVLAARGAELERDYGLGVVHQWLDPVRRLEAPLQPSDPAERDDASFSALHSLYWLVAGLAEEQPLALVLDDAQWSDEASLRFTGFLSRRLEGLPVLVLLTARTPAPGALAELAADPAADRLELRPLGPAAVAELLRARAPGEVDESFALACLEATGGNPFLLGELVQALLDEDVAFVGAERGRVPAVGPRSVATAVQLRLARLGPDAAGLARAAAVAGDDVPLPLATALAGLDEAAAATAADELAAAGVLEDGRPLRFVHPIVAAAIRESLLAGECEALHARAARLLADGGAPASAVALHLLPLEPRGDAEVAATLLEAGQRALAEGAPESAAALLERALAEPPPPGRLAGVLLALGEAEHALERPGAARRLREAIRVADDPRERGRAALLLTWAVVSGTAEPRDVTGLLDACIAELEPVDPDLALRLEAAWLGVAWDRAELDAILERGRRHEGLAGASPGECLVLAHLAHAWMDDGRPAAEVVPLAERAARLEFVRDLGLHSIWLIHTGTVLRSAERIGAALDLLEHAVEEARSRGSLRAYLLASMYRSAVLIRAGDVRGTEADARAAMAAGVREVVFLPAVAQLVESLVEQDRLDEADALLAQHGLAGPLSDFRHGTVLLFSRALLHAARGRTDLALADLAETRRRLDGNGRLNVVGLDGRILTALLHRGRGAAEEAEREAEVALAAARRWGTSGAVGCAQRALALVRDDVDLLREAAGSLAESPLRLEHARALADLGGMLRRRGRRQDSRGPLREALALADECGGIAVRERARSELAASGVRVRREAVRGAAALTPSERRIADLAAGGASNPEIAQALFVTVKTVEMHLSNAYRKLEISGRRELAQALSG